MSSSLQLLLRLSLPLFLIIIIIITATYSITIGSISSSSHDTIRIRCQTQKHTNNNNNSISSILWHLYHFPIIPMASVAANEISNQQYQQHQDDPFWDTIDIVKSMDDEVDVDVEEESQGSYHQEAAGEQHDARHLDGNDETKPSTRHQTNKDASNKRNQKQHGQQQHHKHPYHNPSIQHDQFHDDFDDIDAEMMVMDEVETEMIERHWNREGDEQGQQQHHDTKNVPPSIDEGEDSAPSDADTTTSSSTKKKPIFVIRHQKHYYYEMAFLLYLSIFIWWYLYGKRLNQGIARKFASHYSPIFASQFFTTHQKKTMQFYRESASDYMYYASGRDNCFGMILDLKLRRRQDAMFSTLGSLWFLNLDRRDQVTFSFSLCHMDPFVFALVRKSEAKYYIEDHEDLKGLNVCELPGNAGLGDDERFVYVTDCQMAAQELLSQSGLMSFVKKGATSGAAKLLESVHVSDISHSLYADTTQRGTMRISCYLPSRDTNTNSYNWNDLDRIVTLMFCCVDLVSGKMSIPSDVQDETLSWRQRRQSGSLKKGTGNDGKKASSAKNGISANKLKKQKKRFDEMRKKKGKHANRELKR